MNYFLMTIFNFLTFLQKQEEINQRRQQAERKAEVKEIVKEVEKEKSNNV